MKIYLNGIFILNCNNAKYAMRSLEECNARGKLERQFIWLNVKNHDTTVRNPDLNTDPRINMK